MQDVVGCVLRGPAAQLRRYGGTYDYDLIIGNDVPHRLAGPARISIHARMLLRGSRHEGEPDPWQVEIAAYQYTLLDLDQREILAFHLHPEGPSRVITPHLHLGAGAGQLRTDLAAAHIPTGPVSLAAVARLIIEGFSVRPRRANWDATLRRSDVALSSP